jgi:hypothetical protein
MQGPDTITGNHENNVNSVQSNYLFLHRIYIVFVISGDRRRNLFINVFRDQDIYILHSENYCGGLD